MRLSGVPILLACAVLAAPAHAQPLAQIAKQQGCVTQPVVVDGTDLYKCQAQAGMSYFSGPGAGAANGNGGAKPKSPGTAAKAPTPAGFPRVESGVQRERDDVRKRVLTEELATEVRMMVESEAMLKTGSAPLPDETPSSPKYLDRMAKLKQNVENHSRNVQALNKELERIR
jgi:hypothetical protein